MKGAKFLCQFSPSGGRCQEGTRMSGDLLREMPMKDKRGKKYEQAGRAFSGAAGLNPVKEEGRRTELWVQ